MDDGQESSNNWVTDCLSKLNKPDLFLFICHLINLGILIILVCNVLNLSYLNFYTKITLFLLFAIIFICLLFTILHIYWRRNNKITTTRKKIAIGMIYAEKYLLILCLLVCTVSLILVNNDLMELECKRDYSTNLSTTASTSDYPSGSTTDYQSESIIEDNPKFCIPYKEKNKMDINSISIFGILLLSLIILIAVLCKNKSKIIAEINDMAQIEGNKPQISYGMQNNGQSYPSNNISNFQVNQINNNNIPNDQSVDVNNQISIEKKPKKKKHR